MAAPTVSGAEPAPTCKAMCRRLTDCKMPSYTKLCLDSCKQYGYEASDAGRAQLRVLTRYTCKQIQAAVAGGQSEIKKGLVTDEWMCKAEASFGVSDGVGGWNNSAELQFGNGKTREAAANQALATCNEIMSARESVGTLGGDRVNAGTCEVTKCLPPGSPLR